MTAATRRQRTFVALGMLAVATTASAFAYNSFSSSAKSHGDLGSALPGFAMHVPDIQQYTITSPTGSFSLAKQGDDWVLTERGGFPVAPGRLQGLVDALVKLKLNRVLTRNDKRFDALKLSDPRDGGDGMLIQARDTQGAERAALLISTAQEGLLVRRPGDSTAYVAKGELPALTNAAHFANLDALKLAPERIMRVDLMDAAGVVVVLQRNGPAERFVAIQKPAIAQGTASPSGKLTLNSIALATTPFSPSDVSEEASIPAGEDMTVGTRRITTFDGLEVSLTAKRRGNTLWVNAVAGGRGSSSEAVAINSRTTGWSFAYPIGAQAILFPGAQTLLDAELASARLVANLGPKAANPAGQVLATASNVVPIRPQASGSATVEGIAAVVHEASDLEMTAAPSASVDLPEPVSAPSAAPAPTGALEEDPEALAIASQDASSKPKATLTPTP